MGRAEERELAEHIDDCGDDREPPGPTCAGAEREPDKDEHDAPDEREPTPRRNVEDDDLVRGEHVVVPADRSDQAFEEIDRADRDHQDRGETDPAGHRCSHRHAKPPFV